jgi:mannose-6-phosphate isomerase-like protein (cupin superfamily)
LSVYLEEGRLNNLKPQNSLLIPVGALKKPLKLESAKDSYLYIFLGPSEGKISAKGGSASGGKTLKKSKLFNFHNQYWADLVWTIVNRQYCGKKIFFKKGNNSSFHFHCEKSETYFVHSGKLLLRIKAGKGEDRFFVLNKGQAVDIPPGLIHQAGGLEDTVIMEVSTKDSDGDAFLVESEFTKMPKLKLKK